MDRANETPIKVKAEMTILYRPLGPKKRELIAASGYREFPPRLPGQPIFYPVPNEEYARQIAEMNLQTEQYLTQSKRWPASRLGIERCD